MITDVEGGIVKTIIVKDMSRFGRNYLQVGLYTEMMFPENGVRFVSINDGYDSNNGSDNDFIPFKNIMNEWYAKDTSKKIKSVLTAKRMAGKHLANTPPIGYKHDENDRSRWIIDEEAAETIRRIFNEFISGKGCSEIALGLRNCFFDSLKVIAIATAFLLFTVNLSKVFIRRLKSYKNRLKNYISQFLKKHLTKLKLGSIIPI